MLTSDIMPICNDDPILKQDNVESIGQFADVNMDSLVSECEESGILFANLIQKMNGYSSDSESILSVSNVSDTLYSPTFVSDDSDADSVEDYLLSSLDRSTVSAVKRKREDERKVNVLATTKRAKNQINDDLGNSAGTAERSSTSVGAPVIHVPLNAKPNASNVPINVNKQSTMKQKLDFQKQASDGKQKCMSKNAVMARENRRKKKQQFDELKTCINQLREEKDQMKAQVSDQSKKMRAMQQEIQYLRSVIANETGLSALLKSIQGTGLQFGTPLDRPNSSQMKTKSPALNNNRSLLGGGMVAESPANTDKGRANEVGKKGRITRAQSANQQTRQDEDVNPVVDTQSTAGICLNVSNNIVSVEFCARCSSKTLHEEDNESHFVATRAKDHLYRVAGDHSYGKM